MKTKSVYASMLLLFMVFSSFSFPRAFSEDQLSQRGREAYHTLLNAERFEDIAVGYAGVPSKFVEAYNILLKEPTAASAFKSLLSNGTTAGKLYALCGLFFADPDFFNSSIRSFRYSTQTVDTLFGCLGGESHVSALIEASKPIVIDIKRPKESLGEYMSLNSKIYEEWQKRKTKKKNDRFPDQYHMDILHGGYPARFLINN